MPRYTNAFWNFWRGTLNSLSKSTFKVSGAHEENGQLGTGDSRSRKNLAKICYEKINDCITMSCENRENLENKEIIHGTIAGTRRRDRQPDSATSCHGPDLDWDNCFRSATDTRGEGSFIVQTTFGSRTVRERETVFSLSRGPTRGHATQAACRQCASLVGPRLYTRHFFRFLLMLYLTFVVIYVLPAAVEQIVWTGTNNFCIYFVTFRAILQNGFKNKVTLNSTQENQSKINNFVSVKQTKTAPIF